MKSTFKTTLIIAGIALFGFLFIACGSEDAEESALPAPARPAAPAPAPEEPPAGAPAQAPSIVQQQPAPAQPAREPEAPMPAQAAPAAVTTAETVARMSDAMAMEPASSSNEGSMTESASTQGVQATRALPAPEIGPSLPSAEDIVKAVADGMAEGMKNAQRPTKDEVAQAVQSAVAAATAGQVTRGDVEAIVEKSVQESTSGGLTSSDVQKIVDSALQATSKAIETSAMTAQSATAESTQSALQSTAGAAATGAPPPPPGGGALPPAPVTPPNRDYGDTGHVPSSPPSYDTTFFQNYGVNPFIDPRADHLSTFAMDVDTASYSVARRFVLDGNRPDPDSVRVEEFVNYFDQEYPQPRRGAFAIHVDGARSPFTQDTWIARVGIQGRDVPDHLRKDATLVFVIDTSGSMSRENRLELVKRALRLLVRELRPTDQIGIVTYGSRGHAILNPTEAKHDDYILEVIDGLYPGGSTNAEEGLRLGYEMADRWLNPERITRIILLSDGVANVGQTGPEAILNQVRKYVNEGVTLSTVGVGMGNYNDVLMEQLANDGDGNYFYIDNLTEAWKSFVDNLTSTLQVIARDAKIQVSFNPDVVHSYRLIGYENRDVADRDFRNDSVDAGEVGAGHSVTALYELRLHERIDGPIAKVHVRYEDPDSHRIFEVDRNFNVNDLHGHFESASPRFQLAATVAQYAEVLRESYWAQHTTIDDVRYHADRVGGILRNDPEVTEFARLVNMAAGIADG